MTAILADLRASSTRLLALLYWIVVLAALAVLAITAARAVWLVLSGAGHQVALPSSGTPAALEELAAADFTILERATPFRPGAVERVPTDTQSVDAAETNLNLTLHGVLMGGDDGTAYISVGDAPQASFQVGDTLGSSRAQLERIFADGVLLRRDGILEKLMRSEDAAIVTLGAVDTRAELSDPADTAETEVASPEAEETTPADAPRLLRAGLTRSQIVELAASIRLDPNTGAVGQGFSVFPVRNAELMARAGLRPGDVVQRLGGVVLNSEADLARILANIENETEITVGLVRGGEPATLVVQLSDG